ncbi:lipocalin family protein [Cocleimonas flava]|jgi:apolipoprotein D and lipocalin family protein|uniref:Outer membrane lipoprotein Blc n=1 Tax=Cocleimonas flava TaxID=634765 RepID=A0A4R1F5Q6_9GAMM|nr:lipocalin family protein [Cocleimonas flava]TCJ89263.1 apolipoprotein D and lipocalin family protein [Cocleimonas flava]
MKKLYFMIITLFLSGCSASIPDGIEPVSGFEVNRYLGKWYEIARLDHSFERGLNNISAEYSLREDGNLRVLNRGYNIKKKKWQDAEGKAKFTGSSDTGSLKVSFFGPFYGGYNIIELDKQNYQYVMIAGNDRSYFWILSRTPKLAPNIQKKLIAKAKNLGFPVDKLIYVDHSLATR